MIGSFLYDLFMVPLERGGIRRLRKRFIPRAGGRVLELGAGTGVNLGLYDHGRVTSLTVSDKTAHRLLQKRAGRAGVQVIEADVLHLPFEDASFDTVVFTLLFCSVEDPAAGLREIRRVLRPGGHIIFLEHVLGCSPVTRRVQRFLTPGWKRIAGNCHLDRETVDTITAAGFSLEERELSGDCVLTAGIARR